MDLFKLSATLQLDKSQYDKGLDESEDKAYKTGQKIGSALNTIGKFTAAGITAAAGGLTVLTKKATEEYAQYQQLVGGVQKLYGTAGMSVEEYAASVGKSVSEVQEKYAQLTEAQNLVVSNAEQAFETAGMSTRQYMETATSFSAALINSLEGDTVEAAKQTDVAMRAISDNYNTFGGDMEMIQNAYMGFAKGNYMMLDNLKLGYGGTKTEMERLIADANTYAESMGQAGDLTVDSFSDIVTAIELVQEKQGIAGTTAREAATTVEGSLNMLKGAWTNLIAGMANDEADLGKLIEDVVNSASKAAENLIPVVKQALNGALQLVTQVVPMISEQLPTLVNDLLPPLIEAATQLFVGVVDALPTIIQVLVNAIPMIMNTVLPPLIVGVTKLIASLAKQLPKMIKEIIKVIPKVVKSITDALAQEFPQFERVFKGISDTVSSLFNFIDRNSGTIISLLKGILAGFVAFQVVTGVFSAIQTAIATVSTAVSALQGGLLALNANPIMLLATAAGVLTGAIIACNSEADRLREEFVNLNEVQKAAKDAAEEYNKQIETMKDNNEKLLDSIDLQYKAEEDLVEELKGIVDENGKVKTGYEERAQVITDQLAEAFGIEINYQDGVIEKYGEVMSKIDEVIEKKKAEALISANQDAYIEALNTQVDKLNAMQTAQEELASAEAVRDEALADLTAAQERHNKAIEDGEANTGYWLEQVRAAQDEYDVWQEKVDNLTDAYNEQAQAFYESQATISNYETLLEVMETGVGDLDEAVSNFTHNLITDAPFDVLYNQAQDAWDSYNVLLRAAQDGSVKISQEKLEEMRQYASDATQLLKDAIPEMEQEGVNGGTGYASGWEKAGQAVYDAVTQTVNGAIAAAQQAQDSHSPSKIFRGLGEDGGEGYRLGWEDKFSDISSTVSTIVGQIASDVATSTATTTEELNTSMSKKATGMSTAMGNIHAEIKRVLGLVQQEYHLKYDLINTDTSTAFKQISIVIGQRMQDSKNIISENLALISEEFKNLIDSSYQWGSDFVQNFNDGIISRMNDLLDTVKRMAAEIRSYLHFSVPDKGALADADTWMPDMIDLFIKGIEDNKGRLIDTIEDTFDFKDSIVKPYEIGAGAGGANSGVAGGNTWNINIYQPVQDASEIARKLREEAQYGLIGGGSLAY